MKNKIIFHLLFSLFFYKSSFSQQPGFVEIFNQTNKVAIVEARQDIVGLVLFSSVTAPRFKPTFAPILNDAFTLSVPMVISAELYDGKRQTRSRCEITLAFLRIVPNHIEVKQGRPCSVIAEIR